MNIYAVKDRLIDYYLTPFAARGDKEVMAAIAAGMHHAGTPDAIAQAPQHFEIWKLGEVDEEGHITPKREFLQSCNSLIRPSIRAGDAPTAAKSSTAAPNSHPAPDSPQSAGGTD